MKLEGIILFVLIISSQCLMSSTEEAHDHGQEDVIDPFSKILQFYNITEEDGLTKVALERVIRDFSEKFHCEGDNTECDLPFCLNVSPTFSGGDNETVSEDQFESISVTLIALASGLTNACHTSVNLTFEQSQTDTRDITEKWSGNATETSLSVTKIQAFLEDLPLENDGHDDSSDVSLGEEHGEEEVIEDGCLGADILYDQLGWDVRAPVNVSSVGHLATFVVYHVLSGSHVSRECRLLPRSYFFLHQIFHRLGVDTDKLTGSDFNELMEMLNIGGTEKAEDHTEEDGHGHRRKRSAHMEAIFSQDAWTETCFTGHQLTAIYGVHEDEDITPEVFTDLCPALIQQIVSKSCEATKKETSTTEPPPDSEKYGYGTLATLVICMCSAVGVIFVFRCPRSVIDVIMELFLGLAVGTLMSDAFIHLIPQAMGLHGHEEGAHDEHAHEEGIVVEEFVWYSLVICAGIYIFYLFEKIMGLTQNKHGHTHDLEFQTDKEINNKYQHMNGAFVNDDGTPTKDKNAFTDISTAGDATPPTRSKSSFKPVVLMVLLGDGIHNFADGMAIGASFSSSTLLGLSTSIAVFCHELPHELGDFAILVNSGMSVPRALLFNFLSSLTAMVGLYVGLAVSTDEGVQRWILAAAGGMFLYIALVDMLPQLIHQHGRTVGHFVFNNIGFLLGVLIMVILAIFEEKIEFS